MALSELQRLIVAGLKICKLSNGNIVLASILLGTEAQQWEMAEYLDRVVDNPPDEETIMDKVRQITTPK